MQLEAMQSSAVAGFQEALARSSSGEPSTKEVRDKIQTQSDRIQELQRKVRARIDQASVGILGASQAAASVHQAKETFTTDPEQAKSVQSLGITSIGSFGVGFA
jgi:hypothetical protein